MQQYYHSVCERQQQAVRRNQALQQDARRAHSMASSTLNCVDTSQLETLKCQYQSSVASLNPHWVAQITSQTEGHRQSQYPPVTGQTHPALFTSKLQTTVAPHSSTLLSVPSPSPHAALVSVSGFTPPVTATYMYTTSAPSQGNSTCPQSHTHSSQAPVSVSSVHGVPATTAPLLPTGHFPTHWLPQSAPDSLHSEHIPCLQCSMQSHNSQQPDSLVPTSSTAASFMPINQFSTLCVPQSMPGTTLQSFNSRQPNSLVPASSLTLPTGVTHDIPVQHTDSTSSQSGTPEHSRTMSTESSAVNKMELVGRVSPFETSFEGESGSSRVILTPVVTNKDVLPATSFAEGAPAIPAASTHTTAHTEQPSHSTVSQSLSIASSTVTLATALTTTHTCTISSTHTTTPTTITLNAVSAPSTSTQLPASISPSPALMYDIDLHQQPLDCFPATTSTQPQSVLILSQEGSEPSLSLTETALDHTEDGSCRQSCNGAKNTNAGLEDPLKGKDQVLTACSEDSFLLVQSGSSQSPDYCPPLPTEHAQVLDETRQTPDDLQAVRRSSTETKNSQEDDGMGENMTGSGREHEMTGGTEGICSYVSDVEYPVIQSEGNASDLSDESESGSIADVPLPLSPPPQRPQQKRNGTVSNVIIDSASSSTESQAELRIARGKPAESGHGVQATKLALDPQPHDQADAYTSFLQSVRRTSAMDSPLLDSDSEGIEDILAGGGREQGRSEPDNTSPPSSLSADARGAVGGGTEGGSSGVVTGRGGEHQSSPASGSGLSKTQTKREEKENSLDASDSSHSMYGPSYIPTVVEKQHATRSRVLQKRLGFWGSDVSLDGSDVESPSAASAEDDRGDFDFHV